MKTVTYLTRRNMLKQGSMALVAGGILGRSGWAEATELPMVRRVTLAHPHVPSAFDGLRIAQVADVHAGVFMPPERLARVRSLVEALSPDLVVFTGDQLDRRQVDADFFVHGFAGIDAPLGAFGILGNHDHLAGPRLAVAAMEAVGVIPLVNQSATLKRGISRILLAGVDDLDAVPAGDPTSPLPTGARPSSGSSSATSPTAGARDVPPGPTSRLPAIPMAGRLRCPRAGSTSCGSPPPTLQAPTKRLGSCSTSRGIGSAQCRSVSECPQRSI